MAKTHLSSFYSIVLLLIKQLVSIIQKFMPGTSRNSSPKEISSLDISTKLRFDSDSIKIASSDFGNLTQEIPSAVLYPSSINDIIDLIKLSYNSSTPFTIAPRGHGHSVRGQAMAKNGVVVEMTSLSNTGSGIRVSWSPSLGSYADVGGEQLWIDVLRTTMEHGLAPVSWTDYLYLTVGGTLSNAGISGQSFLHGPQISNVHELDVITGKGEFMTCSKKMNSELFYAVLGGLGQFGVITRARIVLDKAPKMVKWIRMLYDDFSEFTKDQEYLISLNNGFDYIEGSLMMSNSSANNWRSSFFSLADQSKIASLSKHDIIYCLDAVKYYDDLSIDRTDEEMELLVKDLSFMSGFIFKKDDSFVDFLNRVHSGELKLQSKGLWDVPHPWLNLFVPKSRIMDFNKGVFINILHKQNKTSTGPLLVYPTRRNMWDDRMSAVTPDEDVFYAVGLLHSTGISDSGIIDDQNTEILQFCENSGIRIKQYLPHYTTKEAWMKHFGAKWKMFQERKAQFDPKFILSPGQRIFNSVQVI